jgi:acetylornithine deacetylase/succinyl-diaminopimelate desuccinylase-like protein
MNREKWEQAFEQKRNTILKEWETLLQFASIGTDPEHKPDCEACATWLVEKLQKMGFATQLVSTSGNPFIHATREGNPEKPAILIYGHYDVQPVDPLEDWESPPFEPTWRKDRLYARGAQDNKGQLFYTICAVESLIAANALDRTVIFIIDGEEEFGSGNLEKALDGMQHKLRAEALLVHDTGTVHSGAPTLIMGLRGILQFTFSLQGASHDLHSGLHGGAAPNAAQAAAAICASLHDKDGRVAVSGFYNGISPPTQRERELAENDEATPEEYQNQTGARPEGGIRALPIYERVGFLPTLEINGLHSGYAGPGNKTIIPAKAWVTLTARIVAGQNPHELTQSVKKHIEENTPPGIQLEMSQAEIGGVGLRFDLDSALLKPAQAALQTVVPDKTVRYRWEGASIPIVARLAEVSGATPLLTGFGHEDDRIHAPNESFSLNQFRNGFLYTCLFLSQL